MRSKLWRTESQDWTFWTSEAGFVFFVPGFIEVRDSFRWEISGISSLSVTSFITVSINPSDIHSPEQLCVCVTVRLYSRLHLEALQLPETKPSRADHFLLSYFWTWHHFLKNLIALRHVHHSPGHWPTRPAHKQSSATINGETMETAELLKTNRFQLLLIVPSHPATISDTNEPGPSCLGTVECDMKPAFV